VKAAVLTRLLQLASQALPIGGYSHSQGLESAVERKMVTDEASVLRWISNVLQFSMYTFEIPSLLALSDAWITQDDASLRSLNEEFIATRESAELRAATVQMGFSMRALLYALPGLPVSIIETLRSLHEPCLPCVWSAATTAWAIDSRDSAIAYVWSWAENQVLAAIKTLPMGQSAGQRVLSTLGQSIALNLDRMQSVNRMQSVDRDERSNFAPAFAILCAQHETQYSRLFRS
jgi:urease accessory protein